MLRRRIRHLRRYPSLTIMLIAQPLVFLLLFVYVLGGTMGAGLGGDRDDYLAYVTPAVLLLTVASVAMGTAIGVATDMTEGVVARFRTMAIARSSVLTGHVAGRSCRPRWVWSSCSAWRRRWGSAATPGRWPGSASPGCSRCSPSR